MHIDVLPIIPAASRRWASSEKTPDLHTQESVLYARSADGTRDKGGKIGGTRCSR